MLVVVCSDEGGQLVVSVTGELFALLATSVWPLSV